jgi:glycosyltransferase involved in cell wall biosynthesis
MRILYVINGFNQGGAEHGFVTLLENDFFRGHDLSVIALCRGTSELGDTVRGIVGPDRFRLADSAETLTLASLIKSLGVLSNEIANRRPDVAILSLKQSNIVGRMVLCRFPGVRCVSFEHIMRYRSRRFQWSYKYILWLLSFRVDEIWGDCQDTIRETSRYFMPVRRRRTEVVPLFCVADSLPQKAGYAIAGPAHIALASRLSPVKNIDKVIAAVHRLRQDGRDVCLDIFGSGSEEQALQRQIDELSLAGKVNLLGFRTAWYNDAAAYDLYVSASDTEGFCIVVAEAMAAGLPVVATNIGGIRDYGVDEENMLKLDAPNADEIAAKLLRLLDDEDLRQRIGRRAAADMAANYSAEALRAAGTRIFGEA